MSLKMRGGHHTRRLQGGIWEWASGIGGLGEGWGREGGSGVEAHRGRELRRLQWDR